MKILSWNVHNDVTEAKKKHLDELKKEEQFDQRTDIHRGSSK